MEAWCEAGVGDEDDSKFAGSCQGGKRPLQLVDEISVSDDKGKHHKMLEESVVLGGKGGE